jgi:Protein of unknown function (DUF3551)
MRTMAIALITLAALSLDAGRAQAAPWCAHYGGRMGGSTNCGFYSWGQCMATISGIGGYCALNQFELQPRDERRRDYRRQY